MSCTNASTLISPHSFFPPTQQAEENRLSELPQNDEEEDAMMALASGGLGDTTDEDDDN